MTFLVTASWLEKYQITGIDVTHIKRAGYSLTAPPGTNRDDGPSVRIHKEFSVPDACKFLSMVRFSVSLDTSTLFIHEQQSIFDFSPFSIVAPLSVLY